MLATRKPAHDRESTDIPVPAPGGQFDPEFWQRLESLLLPACSIAAIIFVLAGINRSIWLDEANSLSIAKESLSGIIERLKSDNNFPAYYVLLHYWVKLFGDSEIALRLLSGLSYLAASAVVYGSGKSLAGKRVGFYSAFCYLASTQAIDHAQNVRMYALLGLLSAASTGLFCRILGPSQAGRRAWLTYALVNAVGCLTHFWYFFVMAGQFAAVLAWRPRWFRGFLIAGTMSALPFAVLWAPAVWAQIQNGATGWMPPFKPIFVLHALLDFYGGPIAVLFYAACAILIFYHRGERRLAASELITSRLLLTCFAVSLALPLAISLIKPIYWPHRYTIIALPPLALVLGPALARSAARPVLIAFCCLTLVAVACARIYRRDTNLESGLPESQSDRAAVQVLLRLARPRDALIFTSLSRPAIDYYLQRAHTGHEFVEIGFPAENSVHLGWGSTAVDQNRRARLRDEATHAVDIAERAPRVWVLWGYDATVSAILRQELDRRLRLARQVPLIGPYYTSVLEYAPR